MSSSFNQSVKDRLKNLARATGKDYNFICIQFMQERFLARLEKSAYREYFILKGALLLLAYDIPSVRPTKDIDFLGYHISNKTDEIEAAIRKIAEIDLSDGVEFYGNQIEIDEITKDADYKGLRIRLSAAVGGDQQRLQIDIGFGDVIVHGPVEMSYPAMLDFDSPRVKAYSLESAIAEKLHAIVSLGIFGSRMKDYYDIWFLTKNRDLGNERLSEAIQSTFNNRHTDLSDIKLIFENDFIRDPNKTKQWTAFLKRTAIIEQESFESVMHDLKIYFIERLKLV